MNMLIQFGIFIIFFDMTMCKTSDKFCQEESTNLKEPVIWSYSLASSKKVASDPLCITKDQELMTRYCNGSWNPKHDDVPDCFDTQSRSNIVACPTGYKHVLGYDGSVVYCYQVSEAQNWLYPCLRSGSSRTIFDLELDERVSLVKVLLSDDIKRIWLPAKRIIPYGPITWTTIGKDWGEKIEFDEDIKFSSLPITQSCVLLDLESFKIKTENCSYKYPFVCIYKNNHLSQLHCPKDYATTRYFTDPNYCYGMVFNDEGLTWDEFVNTKCEEPYRISSYLKNYLLNEISDKYDYNLKKLCWTALIREDKRFYWYPNSNVTYLNWDTQTDFDSNTSLRGAINKKYMWLLLNQNATLNCMVCQIPSVKYEVDMSLYYVSESHKLFLTIYHSNNLWKKNEDDPGVQCFSNAEGFVSVADIDEDSSKKFKFSKSKFVKYTRMADIASSEIEKIVHEIDIVNNLAGEYWCEGHTSIDMKRLSTLKILVPSKDANNHIFVLKVHVLNFCDDLTTCNPDFTQEIKELKSILSVKSVRIMEIQDIFVNRTAEIIFHINVGLKEFEKCHETLHCNIVKTYIYFLNFWQNTLNHLDRYEFISLSSTLYCLPVKDESGLHWELTRIGDNTAPSEFCMQENGLPVTRKCGGSFTLGGEWENINGQCSRNYEPSNTTNYLYSLSKGKTNLDAASSFLTHDMNVMLSEPDVLIPADIYFLSLSLKTIIELSNENSSIVEFGDINNIAIAIDSIMNVNENYLNLAQTMNSSNVLLESIDMIVSKIAENETDTLLQIDDGIDIAVAPLFLIQISNPSISNITGLALLHRKDTNSTLFTNMDIIPLFANTSVEDVINLEGLEIATWIPQDLLNNISRMNATNESTTQNNTVLNVIISIYYSDVIFQETKDVKNSVNSRIVSVTIPGYDSELPSALPMIYKRFDRNDSDRACAYWDFMVQNPFSLGQWSKKGCFDVANYGELDVCGCFHLTHFAQLVLGYRGDNQSGIIILEYHTRALNAITLVGCSLSLVGVCGIAVTAVIFKRWRQKPGTKILLQLSAAIALQSIMIVSQDGRYESDLNCIILGVLLHYSVLAAFMWMLMTAILQFARYVKVLGTQRPTRFLIKFSLAGWGLPVIPVAILLIVNPQSYLPLSSTSIEDRYNHTALCYPQKLGLYLGVLLPVGCIIVTNLIVFIMVMHSTMKGPDGKRRHTDPDMVLSQLRLSVILFFLLGLSWIFGLLAITGGQIIFSYLFCLTATLQGFVLFVYFVICDPATRVLWVSLVREYSISKDTTS